MDEFGKVWSAYLKEKYKQNVALENNWIPDDEKEAGEKTQARYCYEFYEYLRTNHEVKENGK